MRTCSLCGGRLDNHKRCTLCGLDNTKNDEMYKHIVNQNDCEHMPLTHVHEEPVRNTYSSAKYHSSTYKRASRTAGGVKNGSKGVIAAIVTILSIIIAVFGLISEFIEDTRYEESYSEEYHDPYEFVVDEMPENGSVYQVTLAPGIYKVGVNIPMGIYEAEILSGDYGYIEVEDEWNSIYLYENIGYEEQNIVYDLRLYDGGYFKVSSNIIISISTKNAQPVTAAQQNPLTESYVLTGKATAGKDFVAGIYDIVYVPAEGYEYGYVEYGITDDEGYDYSWSIYFDSDIGKETYHHVVLPENAWIHLNDELEAVTLVPSESVFTTEYEEFYDVYY